MNALFKIRPMSFVLPGIFLFFLGIGNIIVGAQKEHLYQNVLTELLATPLQGNPDEDNPLNRIKRTQEEKEKTYLRIQEVKHKISYYNLVEFGGSIMIALSLISFIAGGVVYLRSQNR